MVTSTYTGTGYKLSTVGGLKIETITNIIILFKISEFKKPSDDAEHPAEM